MDARGLVIMNEIMSKAQRLKLQNQYVLLVDIKEIGENELTAAV